MLLQNRKNIIVALSGSGRTLTNLLKCQPSAGSKYNVCGVIASRQDCRGAEIAIENDLPLLTGKFTQEHFLENKEKIYDFIAKLQPELIVLAGFLKIFPLDADYKNRIINIHPALLPKYGGNGMYGHLVHQTVIASRETVSGATVHFVNDKYDEGMIIAQALVKVMKNDTADDLASKVFAAECDLYPKVINGLLTGDLPLKNNEIFRYEYHGQT